MASAASPVDRVTVIASLRVIDGFIGTVIRFQHQPGVRFADEYERIERHAKRALVALGCDVGEPAVARPGASFVNLLARDEERLAAALAEVLHDVMCDVSHHDRPPARCSKWARYPNIAASAAPRLRAALEAVR